MAVTATVGAGLSYLACRARQVRWYNRIDLDGDDGWQRIETAAQQIVKGVMEA